MTAPSIVLIEDHAGMRDFFVERLSKEFPGYIIVTAGNSEDGIAAAKDPSVVAVITDNSMPPSANTTKTERCAARICEAIIKDCPHLSADRLYVLSSGVEPENRTYLEGMGIHVSADKKLPDLDTIVGDMKHKLQPPETSKGELHR